MTDDRQVATWYAAGRLALGAGLVLVPGVLKGWIGEDAGRPGTKVVARAFGARDIAIALGTLLALEEGTAVRRWLQAGALVDAADALSSLVGVAGIPRGKAARAFALAVVGAVTGGYLGARLD